MNTLADTRMPGRTMDFRASEMELSVEDLDGVTGGALIGYEMMFVATILVLGLIGGFTSAR